jgi:hypothetical protein
MTDPEDRFEAEEIRELGQMGRMMDDDEPVHTDDTSDAFPVVEEDDQLPF